MKKRIGAMFLCLIMFILCSMESFAQETDIFRESVLSEDGTTSGYAYNLYTLEYMGELKNVHFSYDMSKITLNFKYDSQNYDIEYQLKDTGIFEDTFVLNSSSYYSISNANATSIIGLVRDVSNVVSPDTNQFGFVVSKSDNELLEIQKEMEINRTGKAKSIIDNNKRVISKEELPLAIQPRSGVYVSVFAPFNDSFGEMWANLSMVASSKNVTITQYNILTSTPGDGCYLRQYNSSGYNVALWSTPVFPPRGLQTVNRSYSIPWEYSGSLDVTVTGYYDLYGVLLAYPQIYADDYIF